jgi:hypothetical protein
LTALQPPGASPDDRRGETRWQTALEVALIVAVFALHGAGPTPAVNEAHYLGKAKHYWQPDWLQEDFFLGTADSHHVFYFTFGWVTRFLTLPQAAWCGRLLTWSLLAWAWRRLSWALIPQKWLAVLSAALFVALQARCQLAGEWIIGGVEAKGFAYVLTLLALEAVVRNRWNAVWALLGAATAFHVLVGGWALIAAGGVWLCDRQRPSLREMAPGLAAGLGLSLLGLVPGLALTWGVPEDAASLAARIYVYVRLPHHLLPQSFPAQAIAIHASLAVCCAVIYRWLPVSAGERRLRLFVIAAVLLAVVGFVVALLTKADHALAARLLRYYWFRLTDVMLPLGTALGWVGLGVWLARRPEGRGRYWLLAAAAVASAHLSAAALANRRLWQPNAGEVAWRETCQWVRGHTPEEARFLTPREQSTFKWHAQRSEVVTWKDIPQDAAGIGEWWRRIRALHTAGQPGDRNYRWLDSLTERGPDGLAELGREYHAQYVIAPSQPPLDLAVEYRNEWFTVYRLRGEVTERND